MYVIGEVESNWEWTSINYNDPITIGMMQWYGTRAAGLLARVQSEMPSAYSTLAQSLRDSMSAQGVNDSYWNSRNLTYEEGNSIVAVFSSRENHQIQENQAIEDFSEYVDKLEGWGFSQSDPKPLIFAMAMYHQSPKSCNRVVGTAGGSATLDRIYQVCMNDSVLGKYKTRYNTVYERLKAWDGESMPPDFGQNGGAQAGNGGDSGISTELPKLRYIIQNGNDLVLYGDSFPDGVIFYKSIGQCWKCAIDTGGIGITGGNTGGGISTNVQSVVELYTSWVGQFAYSQGGGRLSPLTSGYSDCSGSIWFAYHEAMGIDVGTYTGAMVNKGTEIASGSGANIPLDKMAAGDLLLCWRNGSLKHVEMYIGNNKLCGHGGPDNGPKIKDDAQAYAARQGSWMVRRYA